jgi:hypothetical protein
LLWPGRGVNQSRNEPEIVLQNKGFGGGGRRARACLGWQDLLINELPEEILIQAQHQAAALGTKNHMVIETSQPHIVMPTVQALVLE